MSQGEHGNVKPKKKPRFRIGSKKETPEVAVFEKLEEAHSAEQTSIEPEEEEVVDEKLAEAGYTDADAVKILEDKPADDSAVVNEPAKRRKLKAVLTPYRMYVAAGVIAIIILMLVTATMLITQFAKSPYPEGSVVLEVPEEIGDSGYIFTSKLYSLRGQEMRLLGVMPDVQALVMYLSRYIEAGPMDFYITDNDGRNYYLDMSRHIDGASTNKLYFQPLSEGVESFELFLPDYINSGFEENLFYFDKPISYYGNPARFAGRAAESVAFEDEKAYIALDYASFSNSGSLFNYSVQTSDRVHIIADGKNKRFLNVAGIPRMKGFDYSYNTTANNLAGRAGYWPLDSQTKEVKVLIDNLVCRFELDANVANTGDLFLNDDSKQIRIPFDKYTLVLERMGKRGNMFVLVLHTLDNYGDRVYGNYTIELVGKSKNGGTVTMEGIPYIGERGSDFLFVDADEELSYTSPADVTVVIKDAEVRLNPVEFAINVSELDNEQDSVISEAAVLIEEEFRNRNAGIAMYTAQVAGVNFDGNTQTLHAVVYEAFEDSSGGVRAAKYGVVAELSGGAVKILDEVSLS